MNWSSDNTNNKNNYNSWKNSNIKNKLVIKYEELENHPVDTFKNVIIFINNLLNNNGIVEFEGKLEKVSKYKFSKIKQFDYFQPELLISKNNSLIFFNKKGTILNFADNKKQLY